MIQSCNLLILAFHFLFIKVKAQPKPNDLEIEKSNDVQPSLAVLVGILSMIILSTFFLLLYAKLCHRRDSDHHGGLGSQDSFLRSRFSGIDKNVVESLPYFRFSALKGSKQGLECAVCLSKFEDIEILRLLPKCKHAFHISCIDEWLFKHSSCPICRQKVSPEDISILKELTSLRFLWNQTEETEESHLEVYVEREEDHHLHGKSSSRFCIGSSFRKPQNGNSEEELPIQQSSIEVDDDQNKKVLHKFNHKIIISDVVLKNRWSNISSSDLMFLNSEMLSDISSNRFSALEISNLESRGKGKIDEDERKGLNPCERRSMSEITVHPRFRELSTRNNGNEKSSFPENNVREERKMVWLSIARNTVQWFSNRDRRSLLKQDTMQSSIDASF